MTSNNSIGSLIVKDQTLGEMVKLGGTSKLGAIGAAVKHESGRTGGLPMLGPEISDDAGRRDLSSVIQRQFNGYGTEEIVKEHSVTDVTPSRLEEKMNMLYFSTHRDS